MSQRQADREGKRKKEERERRGGGGSGSRKELSLFLHVVLREGEETGKEGEPKFSKRVQ